MLTSVPTSGTPKKTVRVDDVLWGAYGEACMDDNISCAEDLRNHMRWKVEQHRQRKAKASSGEGEEENATKDHGDIDAN